MNPISYLKICFLLPFLVTTQHLTAQNLTAPVGIGNTNPHFNLDVSGAVSMGGTTNNLDPGQPFAPANLPNLVGSGKILVGWNRMGGFGESDFITNTLAGQVGGFAFWNQNSSGTVSPLVYMSASTGNVLIGNFYQTNTAYKLDVSGNVRANEVVVNTTGADFVFDTAYRLAPLAELKDYIHTYHHLPDLEPATRMQEEGIKLGDTQTRLLQKIEELTLYMIDQDKKMEALQKANEALQKSNERIDVLEEQLKELKASLPPRS